MEQNYKSSHTLTDLAWQSSSDENSGSLNSGDGGNKREEEERNRKEQPPSEEQAPLGPGIRAPLVPCWTKATLIWHDCLARGVTQCAMFAARHPKPLLASITVFALVIQLAGLLTNFQLVLDFDVILTPVGSRPQSHAAWINAPSHEGGGIEGGGGGFPQVRTLQMVFHNHGSNVLHTPHQTRRVLEAIDLVRNTPGYTDLCRTYSEYSHFETNEPACRMSTVSSFWTNHSLQEFDQTVFGNTTTTKSNNNETQQQLALASSAVAVDQLQFILSQKEFADGSPVLHDLITGNYRRNSDTIIEYAESFLVQIELPDAGNVNDVEANVLSRLDSMRREWLATKDLLPEQERLTMDMLSVYGYQLEIMRTVFADLWLLPLCILGMVGFTCLAFLDARDNVQSRCLLGVYSVVTICMSYMTGNGIMFLCGVPYSVIHQMLPYVIFGIGLDDTFIITGAYFRTSPKLDIEERIRITMQEVANSISLTTITTVFAFVLGYFSSSFPGVHWLCLYAMTIITIDFFYQITYFVALLALDEQRVQANRRDCCCWITVEQEKEDNDEERDSHKQEHDNNGPKNENVTDSDRTAAVATTTGTSEATLIATPAASTTTMTKTAGEEQAAHTSSKGSLQVRIMVWYSEFLLRPWVRVAVLVVFAGFFALNCYSASLLEQHFNIVEYVASDSYLYNVFDSLDSYSSVVRPMGIYFRYVDQTDPLIQQQMIDYVNQLEQLDQIGGPSNVSISEVATSDEIRPFCWVRDFQEMQGQYDDPTVQAVLENMTFIDQLNFALSDKVIREVYGQDIVRDETGNITASRCVLFLKSLDLESVQAQIDMLNDQHEVTMVQPINQLDYTKDEWRFFAFDELFFYWEAYAVAVDELISTMAGGVIAVCVISAVFMPHWTAVAFVLPFIVVLYIDLLGTVRFFGLNINGLTYVCVVVAIGLLVDFVFHILLRYYEASPHKSREERVKETLQTMGVSILVGGLSTLLGVIPICLSELKIFMTVFYSFFAMVVIGLSHGLILLPVVLSFVGPTMAVQGHHLAPMLEGHADSSLTIKSEKPVETIEPIKTFETDADMDC